MLCRELTRHMKFNHNIKYDHIYGSLEEQIGVTLLYSSLLEKREHILEERSRLPGGGNSGVGTPSCAGGRFAI